MNAVKMQNFISSFALNELSSCIFTVTKKVSNKSIN